HSFPTRRSSDLLPGHAAHAEDVPPMMSDSLVTVSYLVAAVLFILSLGGLSTQERAGRGNAYGIAGMLIALAVTAATQLDSLGLLAGAVAAGALVGAVLALRVEMTSMPEL